jgi:ribulose-5-phosphate 4-epimerase/fuculose-1-phosphate aldolase
MLRVEDLHNLRSELISVFHLIHKFGWDDLIYTHASVRIPNTNTFLVNPYGICYNELSKEDLLIVDEHGKIIKGSGDLNPAAFTIHSAIHTARTEVACIIHTHTKEGVAVSIDKDGLWPISQRAAVIMNNLAYHDYMGILVDEDEKESLVKNLGDKSNLIMRNHGLLTAGKSIGEAFVLMRNLQLACEIQVLCDRDRAIFVRPEVIADIQRQAKVVRLDSKNPSGLPWEALKRML